MHPILRLVEHDRGRRLEDLVGDLECGQAAPFVELLPDLGLGLNSDIYQRDNYQETTDPI